ncbi:MAG: hypothetical protein QOD06_1786 [Candidatus Binatota bacterium]|nr:hypothetical protein [Candidatus Binatota bacterium]
MAVYLKTLAIVTALFGLLCCGLFTTATFGDEPYYRSAAARERNAGNLLFETEYRMARAQHVFLIYSAVGSLLTALVGGSLLWGLAVLHRKLDALAPDARVR